MRTFRNNHVSMKSYTLDHIGYLSFVCATVLLCLVSGCATTAKVDTTQKALTSDEFNPQLHFKPLLSKTARYIHIQLNDELHLNQEIDANTVLGIPEKLPLNVDGPNSLKINQAIQYCRDGKYKIAYPILEEYYTQEKDSFLFMYYFGLAKYWVGSDRIECLDLFRETIRLSAELAGITDPMLIADTDNMSLLMDSWLTEIYWKLGTVYLDTRDYSNAVLNITKAISLIRENDQESRLTEQQYSYLTEAYYYLGDRQMKSYFMLQTLKINPRNSYVTKFVQ